MGKAITISKDFGCGGVEFARKLAHDLGYQYLDKALIQELARKMNTSEGEIKSYEDGTSIAMFRFFSKYMTRASVKAILADDFGFVDDCCYCEALNAMMHDLADQGDVVIVGRGGQCLLAGRDDVIHLRCIGSMEYKRKFLSAKEGVTPDEAEHIITKKQAESRKYVEALFSRYNNDPELYHLTINLELIDLDTAVRITKSLL